MIISSAVLPASLTLLWSGQSALAATLSPILGLACSLAAWLATAKAEFGTLTVDSTGSNDPMLAGNVVALLSPLIFVPLLTLITGSQRYDWKSMAEIRLGDDTDLAEAAGTDPEAIPGHTAQALSEEQNQREQATLSRAAVVARSLTVALTLALLVLWPMPMYGSSYVFSRKFFTGWVVVGIMWLFFSAACVGLFPLWEGRSSMTRVAKCLVRDLSGKGRKGIAEGESEDSVTGTPREEVEKVGVLGNK